MELRIGDKPSMTLEEALAVMIRVKTIGYKTKAQLAALMEADRVITNCAREVVDRYVIPGPGFGPLGGGVDSLEPPVVDRPAPPIS